MPALELDGAVTLNNLHKAYGDRVVVNDVSLEVKAGEFFSMLGPSGCGKSTLLRLIAGLEDVSGGRIEIEIEPGFDSRRGAPRGDSGFRNWPNTDAQ